VRLDAPGKPGLFTDMREVRASLAPMLRGRRFLNLFAHTGAFSAVAAAAGAGEVVSVDLSRPFLDVAARSVALNAPDFSAHETVAEDVFEAVRRFAAGGRRFDAILVDPPTFSSSRASGAFSVKDGYRPLVRAALRVLEPGGLLVAATNWRGIEREAFLRLLHDAAETERTDLRILAVWGQPADYPAPALLPEARHLHVALCSVPA
jgi:23S rRNA (cytosine1962-C5)-methyltransferase